MSRYSTKNDWHLISEEEIVKMYPQVKVIGNIKTYSGTLVDKEGDQEYDGGAMKVIVELPSVPDGPPAFKKTKTFKGETAWMDAERWSNDMVQEYKKVNSNYLALTQ